MELVYMCRPNGRKLHLILQREIVKQQRDSLTTEDSWTTQFIFKKEERFSTYDAGATGHPRAKKVDLDTDLMPFAKINLK